MPRLRGRLAAIKAASFASVGRIDSRPRPATMLLVKTYLDRSRIHGMGVFADEFIGKGRKVWRFVEGFDRAWSPQEFARLPRAARDFIQYYGYRVDGEVLLTVDHDRHLNHSDNPNTIWRSGYIVARRDIAKGQELTNDYRMFDLTLCAAFLKKK
jgi:hypothetical protein